MNQLRNLTLLIFCIFCLCSFKNDKRYLITQYGAVGDGKTLNTKAIQATIDACAEKGGGRVVIPSGTFVSGSVFLKKNVNMYIEEQGVLKGSADEADYPQIETRWEGEERRWTACLLNAISLSGIEVGGKGMIDGSGDVWTRRASEIRQQQQANPSNITRRQMGRPRLIGFQNCKNITIADLKLKNQASWGLFVLYSENVKIKNLYIRAEHNIPSSDGIDIDSSKDILITGCDIDVNDDCISIKSGKDEDGLRVNRPAQDIVISKTRFGYGHGGVAMGSETSGGIRNVTIKDCVFEADNWAPIRFKSQPSRGGVVENITYKNLKLNGTRKAFEFNMAWRMVNPKPPTAVLPVVRNVKIINVSGSSDSVGDMRGLEGSPIQDVVFKNCNITAKRGFAIEHAMNVDLSGLVINRVDGEPVSKKNVN